MNICTWQCTHPRRRWPVCQHSRVCPRNRGSSSRHKDDTKPAPAMRCKKITHISMYNLRIETQWFGSCTKSLYSSSQGDPPEKTRREDDLIAWTWRRYVDDTSEPFILLQLPMTKVTLSSFICLLQILPLICDISFVILLILWMK